MIVYNYDPVTFVFTNTSSEADEDPMEPGHWLIPANATPAVPPSPPDPKKQRAAFRDGEWIVEAIPLTPSLQANLAKAPIGSMWPRLGIKEALKGGVT